MDFIKPVTSKLGFFILLQLKLKHTVSALLTMVRQVILSHNHENLIKGV